jgi:hypothetical protein
MTEAPEGGDLAEVLGIPEVTVRPSSYEVTAYPYQDDYRCDWVITVARRGTDNWTVLRPGGGCWNRRTKMWDYEPMPVNRTAEFKRTHRFPLEDALDIARREALQLTVVGMTLSQAIAWAREEAEAR